MMNCPACDKPATVMQTRKRDGYVYRRLICGGGHRFSTVDGVVCDPGLATRIRKADVKRTIEAGT